MQVIKDRENAHNTDSFFVLLVLLIIGVIISLVLLFSLRSYEGIAKKTEDNFELRTSIMYLSNKIKAFDEEGCIEVGKFGEGTALVLNQEIEGVAYETKIYMYENNITELFTEKGNELDPVVGTPITQANGFEVEESEKGVLKITVTSPEGNKKSLLCGTNK